mmetsp:Transcript_19187/g.53851  ORF Transcript_19187/g.53851 Transcript_19187/m.53851 type:complete len:176 (-) Transcript_19187:84-611(-)
MGDVQQWYDSVPVITRHYLTGCVVLTIAGNVGMISPMQLILTMAGLYRFEVWRLLTCFMFMGKLGFPFLLNMIYFYRQSSTLESQTFERRTSDYLFMILFGALLLLPIGLYFQFYLLGQGIMLMVTYYWSRMNPNVMISFFGIPFKGRYLPWVLVALNFLMGGMPIVQVRKESSL